MTQSPEVRARAEPLLAPHACDVTDLVEQLGTDLAGGLGADSTLASRELHGPNLIVTETGSRALQRIVAQFDSALVWILIVAAVVSGVALGEWIDTTVIAAIVILNAVIGYVQEGRAEKAMRELAALTSPMATVRRGGSTQVIVASDVVVGDLLVLDAGDRVAADARVVESANLTLSESIITGESQPVHKEIETLDPSVGVADRTNMVLAGTTVDAGRGIAVVTSVGLGTQFGRVVELLEVEEPKTPLTVELDHVGTRIAIAAIAVSALVFALGIARQVSAETMFLTAVAVAVAAIPEGLTAQVTMTLSRGVSAMARHRAIVRQLPAVEALGAATVICTDKTGTLTKNQIEVQHIRAMGEEALFEVREADPRMVWASRIATLCNDARRASSGVQSGFVGDPTEVALISMAERHVDPNEVRSASPRLDEIPFDSVRKRMATLHDSLDGEGQVLYVKGAPESIEPLCVSIQLEAGTRPLAEPHRGEIISDAERLARSGLRVLALAYRTLDSGAVAGDVESDLTFVGLVAMSDAIRPEAVEAVLRAHGAGLHVVMITGDHAETAETVARDLGILSAGTRSMTGAELHSLTIEELANEIGRVSVFARVDPADKVAIVQAWQARGDIVAMTGDGVNDAPALRAADIGIAMGSGTAVAHESSAMVLADDNFATIVTAVAHGRGIFQNLTRVVYFLLSANISELLVMLIAFIAFGSLGEPLLASQLLWINLVTDGFPALALGADRTDPDVMERPPLETHSILSRERQKRLLWQGSVLALCALGGFLISYVLRDATFEHARTVLFTALVGVQLAHIYSIRSEARGGRRTPGASRWMAAAVLISASLQVAVVQSSFGNEAFGTVPLDAIDWLILAILSALSMGAVRLALRFATD